MTRAIDTLADNIRRRRLARKLSLRDLATAAGISASYLNDIESGARIPSRSVAEKLEMELHATGIVAQARAAVVERWDER